MSNFRRDDNRSIYDVVEDMVDASGKNRREIAVEIGKEYSTLRRELNPYDEGAKLGAELLLPLMRSTGRKDIAEWFEHARTKHPLFAQNERHGLKVIRDEFLELTRAVDGETPDRQKDEALDVIATCCRFVLGEWGGDLGAKKKGPSQAGQTGQKRKWSRPQDQEGF